MDETFLDPKTIPRPGVAYNNTEFKWIAKERVEAANDVRALLKK